jgi:hypothetical protein
MSAPAPATARAASWTFSAAHRSAPQARRAVRTQPVDGNPHHTGPFAELLVSELVANALEHAPGLVQTLSSTCGSAPTGGGKVVSFALPVPAALDA